MMNWMQVPALILFEKSVASRRFPSVFVCADPSLILGSIPTRLSSASHFQAAAHGRDQSSCSSAHDPRSPAQLAVARCLLWVETSGWSRTNGMGGKLPLVSVIRGQPFRDLAKGVSSTCHGAISSPSAVLILASAVAILLPRERISPIAVTNPLSWRRGLV